jgi:5-methylthioadenosine/S-adenosylhomocysteine deaminase
VKTLVRGGCVLQMDAARTFLDEGFVLIEDATIVSVGPLRDAPSASEVNHVEDASGCIIVPGLINSHQHHWYHLLKGISAGLDLEDWVDQVLRPVSAALTTDDFLVSMQLAAADMLSKGTTTFFNHSVVETRETTVEALAEISAATGIRQVFGKEVRATPQSMNSPDHRAEIEKILDGFPYGDGPFSVGLAVETGEHWIRQGTMTAELASYVSGLSERFGVPVSDHVTGGSLARSVTDFRRRAGIGQVEWIKQHGLLNERSLLAHSVWIDDGELSLVAGAHATIVTCPSSSAFTAGGIPPVRGWLRAGINVSLGSDGPMVNDSVDLLGLLRECFLLQSAKYLTPAAVTLDQLWNLPTRNAAAGLGLSGRIGELSPGSKADLAVFDLHTPEFGGVLNPPANLLLSGSGHDARFVMVDGQVVKDQGGLQTLNVAEVLKDSRDLARGLAERAGLGRRRI